VAFAVGIIVSTVFRGSYGLATGVTPIPGEVTTTVVVLAMVSGFWASLVGGFVAGRAARRSGGLHGATMALLGLALGILLAAVLAVFGVIFVEAVAAPPACFGIGGGGLQAGLVVFLGNLFGGFVGGMLGAPANPG